MATKATSSNQTREGERKRYERLGATARDQLERRVRQTRARLERDLRTRRTSSEGTVIQDGRRSEPQVSSVRKDFEKPSERVGSRVERLVSASQIEKLVNAARARASAAS